jgi:hypothetical protein
MLAFGAADFDPSVRYPGIIKPELRTALFTLDNHLRPPRRGFDSFSPGITEWMELDLKCEMTELLETTIVVYQKISKGVNPIANLLT